jgi:hypothetical protein
VRSRRSGNGLPRQCSTFVYRSDGKPVVMCGGLSGFRMVLLDPDTLDALAHFDLPIRPSSFEAFVKRDMSIMMNDSSGGAYMFLDNRDRLVFANSQWVVQRLVAEERDGKWSFRVEREWDLKPYVPNDCFNWNNWSTDSECDKITTVMPDHQGRYWWTTRNGRLGTLDPESGAVKVHKLAGEEIQNALAMDVEDDYTQKQLSFGGLAEIWNELRLNLSSALKIPMNKLFGQSATGFGGGEDALENYNAIVEQIREDANPVISEILDRRGRFRERHALRERGATHETLDDGSKPLGGLVGRPAGCQVSHFQRLARVLENIVLEGGHAHRILCRPPRECHQHGDAHRVRVSVDSVRARVHV